MSHRSHLTILVIDDCAEDQEIYHQYLQQDRLYTYNILEFQTAKQAMIWCQQQIPDVILLDYLLPDDDGLGFLQNLRENLNNSQSAVIMLTGQGDETIAVRAMKKGAQDYLVKNHLTPEILQSAIHHAVELKLLTQQLEQSRQQQMMAAIALRIRQSLELEEILTVTAAEVRQFLQTDRVVIYQFQPDMSGTVVAESILPGWTVAMGAEIPDNCFKKGAGADYHQGKKRAIDDINQAGLTPCDLQLLEQLEVKAFLVVPILVTNKLWGLLIAHQCTAPRHWQSFELDLLDQLAVQIAIAIQQASAYQQVQTELQERKRAEATLRESEQRFRQMADTVPVLIWMAGLDKAYQYFNKTWLEFTGKTLEEEVGDGWAQRVHPDDLQDCLDTYINAFDARQHFQMEYRLERFDGKYRWILDTGTPRFTSEGEFLGYIGSCVDISDVYDEFCLRKQVEQALRQNEERLSLALEAARMGNWDWNITTGEIHWSANLEKLFGMVPGTFDGQYETFMTMIHPDDRESVVLAINRAVYEREDYNIEFRFIKLDGTLHWALGRGRVFYDQKGNPVRMSGVDKDITERKHAEVALKESEARFQAFMNNSPAASWITDENGRMLYLSQTYLRTFQLPSEKLEDVIGKTVFEVYPAEIAQQFLDNIRQVVETQQILETIELAPRPDGTVGDFLVYKFPLSGTTKPLMIGGVAVDISDKIRAERALQQLNLELEARVEERTAALRESEERWHLALRGSNDGIWDWNIKTSEVFFSARWSEMLGFAENELIHNFAAWSNRIHLDDRDRIMKVLADHLAHKTPFFQEEYQIKCKDSSYIWILDRGQALWDEFGNAIRMSGSATDISKRKQTEAALLAVTRLKQAILASIDYAIISTNSEGIIQTFNLAAQKMLGYTANEVIGQLTLNRFHDPEELSQEMGRKIPFEDLSMLKTQQDSCEVEWTFIRKDGSRFPVALSIKPLCNLEGQIIGGVGIAKDITQQKQIEAQLRKNAANLESAQRIANLGRWEMDLQTQQLIWSEEVFRIFGRNPESGTPSYNQMLNWIHPDDRDRCDLVLLQAIEQGQPYEIEYRFYRADGSLGYLLSRGEFILDINRQPCQLISTILDITKRKQTEEQLRNLSDRLTLALKSANIGIWDWNMIHALDWDDRMYELYDLQRSDVILAYQEWANRLHPDDRTVAETTFQNAVEGVKELDTEFRIILADGSIRFIKASALIQHNERGEPQRMVGINYDITDRKQVELALRESEHRYATLTEAAPVAIFRLDAASNCIYVNERWGLMMGKPTAAALGKGWLENIHLEECDRLLMDCSDPFETRCKLHKTYRQEVRYLRPDGCISWFYMQIVPENNPSGTLVGYIGTLTDITIRKEIESEVNHHRDLREAIFNESTDALFLVDSETYLIFDCNRRAVELFEVSKKEELINIKGNTLQRYQFTPQELDEIIQEVNQKSSWSREIEYVTRKGNLFWGNLATKQITIAGKMINLVRLSDISERKKAVEQIQRSLEEKETLLKEIHHRVKNNLQIISSLLRMQSRRSDDETTLSMFKESQDRVQSMALIHEQLYQSADVYEINFDNYIKSLIDSLFRSYGVSQKNIVLNIETNGIKLPLDTAIPCGLIINELVSNCLKYAFSEQEKGNITICLEQCSEKQLNLVVKDNGIGISETLDWENSNSLGLRIVKNLVRQLKGNIILEREGVNSHRHRGTTFYIHFPQ